MPSQTPPAAKPAAPVAKAAQIGSKVGIKAQLKAKGITKALGPKNNRAPTAGKNRSGPMPRTSTGALAAGPDDPKYTEITPIVVTALLAALAEHGRITKVCEDLRLNRHVVHALKEVDPEFKKRYDDAMHKAFEGMEDEVRRRAFQGYDKPVFQGGVKVGTITEYSDRLAELMIRSHKPEVYSERVRGELNANHTGQVGVTHTFSGLTEDQLNAAINKKLRFLGVLPPVEGEVDDKQDVDPEADSGGA